MRFVFVAIYFVLFLILAFYLFVSKKHVPSEHVVIAEKIQLEKARTLCDRHDMVWIGEGGGMMHYVSKISLSFQLQGPLPKLKLRKILVDCVEELLAGINSERKLKGHLKREPFTEEEIDIDLFVVDANGLPVVDPEISIVSGCRGRVVFITNDPSNPNEYKSETEESYEEARRSVGR